MLRLHLEKSKDIIVTGICFSLDKVDKLFGILRIDIVIIVSPNISFILSCLEKSFDRPALIIGPKEIILHQKLLQNCAPLQFISVCQNLESLNEKLVLLSNEVNQVKASDQLFTFITKREKEILMLISKGRKNKEIAEELYLSVKTVENHRNNILAKTKVKNMLILINELHKIGFLRRD